MLFSGTRIELHDGRILEALGGQYKLSYFEAWEGNDRPYDQWTPAAIRHAQYRAEAIWGDRKQLTLEPQLNLTNKGPVLPKWQMDALLVSGPTPSVADETELVVIWFADVVETAEVLADRISADLWSAHASERKLIPVINGPRS